MKPSRWIATLFAAQVIAAVITVAVSTAPAHAQGVTTGAIAGTITDAAGAAMEGVQVQVVSRGSGYATSAVTRANGYYIVPNLEVGGYTIKARRIGFEPAERTDVVVSLSVTTRVDLTMSAVATALTAVRVVAANNASDFSPTRQGVSTQVSDSLISHMPQLNRNITDLTKLVPQMISPPSGGASAGGMYNRLNNFTIDGGSQNDRFNLNSSGGIPGGANNGRIISADAVKEFKVFLSPTDVRQANFTGMLFNAVTKSGTNEWHGGAMYNYRNDANMSSPSFRATPINVRQWGFQLGGPIIKDRLHIYLAPEWQHRVSLPTGPFVDEAGNSANPASPLNIAIDSIRFVQDTVRAKMGFEPGTAGRLDIENPLSNLFGRLDFRINDHHRLVLRQLINRTENTSFSRNTNTFSSTVTTQTTGFRLGSNSFVGVNTNRSSVAQLYSSLVNGMSNELLVGFNTIRDERKLPTDQLLPEMAVGIVPIGATGAAATNPTAVVTFGTEQFSVGNLATQDITEYQDNVTIPAGAHTFTLGARYERVKIYNNFPQGLGGVWRFPTLAALRSLTPSGYAVGYANSGNDADIPAVFKTNMPSVYAQDQWTSSNLTVTVGLRGDMPRFNANPLENKAAADSFASGVSLRGVAANQGTAINTTWMPADRMYWSPRVGVNWNPGGNVQSQVRGNLGVFTGPPPFILVANALQNNGLGLVLLSCTGAGVPAFTTDVTNLPKACAGGTAPVAGASGTNTLNINDPNFKYPQYTVASGGADRQLAWGFVGTFEGIYKKAINGLRIRDLNLLHPALNASGNPLLDRNGRVLYADSILLNGTVLNSKQYAIQNFKGTAFTQRVVYLTNESHSYNYSLTGQLRRAFGNLSWTGAYTYTRAYDIQALTSDRAISNWNNGREYSGREDDNLLTTSPFERRHRAITYGTLTMPWGRGHSTDITVFYEGISGFPITYTSSLDLNGDGQPGNDPIYVPRSALDTTEIRIGALTGASATSAGTFAQDGSAAAAFNDFITSQKCLDKQRGHIMQRASCRGPWQNRLDLSVRQLIPTVRGENFVMQLDINNVSNVLGELLQHLDGNEREWGKTYSPTLSSTFPQQQVLAGNTSSGSSARTAGPFAAAQPVYTFNSTARTRGAYNSLGNNGYNMALTLRYTF